MDTNDFLYFRDIRNDPRPQAADVFSCPYEQAFFFKFMDHLAVPHTDACLDEAFRQFDAHCRLPLSAQRFLNNPNHVARLKQFFMANPKWQPHITEALKHLFGNKSTTLFGGAHPEVREDIFGLVFSQLLEHPDFAQIIEALWAADTQLIDVNENAYAIKFDQYLEKALTDTKLQQNVGDVCACLSILTQMSYGQQSRCLNILQKSVLKLLGKRLPTNQIPKTLTFVYTQVLQDARSASYLAHDGFPQTLLRILQESDDDTKLLALEVFSYVVQHYPPILLAIGEGLGKVEEELDYLSQLNGAEQIEKVILIIQNLKDGPLRGSAVMTKAIANLVKLGRFEGVDGVL